MTLMKSVAPFLLLFFILVELSFAQKVDLTRVPNVRGKDVTDAVIKKVRASRIFPQDNEFLQRLAYVETKFGNDSKTYSDEFSGGIWKVDQNVLLETQNTLAHPSLLLTHFIIAGVFQINWPAVTSVDLLKPLYSGLAARIFLTTLPESIPGTIKSQAEFWQKYYHKTGTGTVDTFITEINEMQNNFRCQMPLDECIVLDGSGSISSSDFEKARNYVYKTINTTYCDATRICLIVFSSHNQTYFNLENRLSKTEMLSIVQTISHPRQTTNTREAILEAVRVFNVAYQRPGVPKAMFVLTDGMSNDGVKPGPTDAMNSGIITFAGGIGPNQNRTELIEIANGIENNVFNLSDFAQLVDTVYRFNTESCSLAQKPLMNTEVEDNLLQYEKRFYNFKLSSNGISITVKKKSGQSVAYFSYTETTPSSALHDGQFSGYIFIPSPVLVKRSVDAQGDQTNVFIAVEGLETDNIYTIFAQEGYFPPIINPDSTTLTSISPIPSSTPLTPSTPSSTSSTPSSTPASTTASTTSSSLNSSPNSSPGSTSDSDSTTESTTDSTTESTTDSTTDLTTDSTTDSTTYSTIDSID